MDNELLNKISDVLFNLDERIHKMDIALHWIASQSNLGHDVQLSEHRYCQELIKEIQIAINSGS